MSESLVNIGGTFEDRPCWLIGRLCAVAASGLSSPRPREGKLVQRADIQGSTLSVKAYDEAGNEIATDAPAKSSVVYDTLQTGGIWGNVAGGGGNILYQAPASFFPRGGTRVRIEMSCTLTDGVSQPTGVWDLAVKSLSQS